MAEDKSFKDWQPLISPEKLFESKSSLKRSYLRTNGKSLFWTESRPHENGRIAIVTQINDVEYDITPIEFNARSKVHEYGGLPYTVYKNIVYFVNFEDQRLYYVKIEDQVNGEYPNIWKPIPLTPEKNADYTMGMYAAMDISPDGKYLVFVYEKSYQNKENENFIAYLNLTINELLEPTILTGGNDFYADPKFNMEANKICWVTWNHPNMPWDGTKLYLADFDGLHPSLTESSMTLIDGGNGEAICQPIFDNKNNLYYVKDLPQVDDTSVDNWWNIYCWNGTKTDRITNDLGEYGTPMWGLGLNRMMVYNKLLLCPFTQNGTDRLAIIDLDKNEIKKYQLDDFTYIWTLINIKDHIYCGAGSPTQGSAILDFLLSTKETIIHHKIVNDQNIDPKDISIGNHISFKTENDELSFAYFYEPKNPKYKAPQDELPPLVVKVHGGPTSRTSNVFSGNNYFWTSSGYAVIDVNHRGSTGYGRKYRDKLLGEWGNVDAIDVKNAVKHLQNEGLVADKVVITGGSAGGYAVQRALTMFPKVYNAGASYFGIGNLETLYRETHKFESRYLDQMLGGKFEDIKDIYLDRSPIYHIDQLKSPMILFQGLEDKVVTPQNSREMANMLSDKKIYYEYVEYEGEGHGFRKKETNIDALTKESNFYKKVLFDEE